MKNHLKLVWAAMVAMTLSACSERISVEQATDSDRKNEYTKAWIQSIGLIPADQDWCMIDAVTANISTDGLENGTVTKIYTSDPKDGGRLKATITDSGTAYLDVREGTTELYAMIYNSDGVVVAQGLCSIDNGVTAITPSTLSPKRMSRHVDDFMTSVTFDAIIVCEDLGTIGDFDFNDIVLGLTTETVEDEKHLKIYPLAAGGILTANILFGDDKVNKGEIHELMQDNDVTPEGKFYNTTSFDKNGSVIDIEVGSTWTIANNWQDIKISIQGDANTAYEISAAPAGSAPEMICLSGDFFWPKEGVSIKTAYTDFVSWATGGYQGDDLNYSWLDSKADAMVVPWEITIPGEPQNYFIATCNNGTTGYTYKGTTYASDQRVYVDGLTDFSNMFNGANYTDFKSKIISIDVNGSHFDTSNVTNLSKMFRYCFKMTTLDLSNWDVSKVTNMTYMFQYCEGLNSPLDLSNWDTSSVTDMAYMFQYCKSLSTLDLSNWNVSKVTNMNYLFDGCLKLTSLDISKWDVSKVQYMNFTFNECKTLTTLDVSNWDVSNVKSMVYMFSDCYALTPINVSNWNVSKVTDLHNMFTNCNTLSTIDVSKWDVSNVTDTSHMFSNCDALSSIDVSNWDVSKVRYMNNMFSNCKALTTLDLSNWNPSPSIGIRVNNMFQNCENLTQIYLNKLDASKIDTSMEYITDMFSGCPDNLEITCKSAFRDWCITNKETIGLPSGLQSESSSQWHIVD